ncbi:hypothetical protein N5S93_09845 [Aliarcobacter cryaerophilus]|uniref:hypothetical protein n=1 Tax=Aliarcobacter cryaerophilus TaxID=28198 RepID=UPI0021B26CDF|nr:hypothetical protein [Aliarcobacter cryaerophilus]MCT7495920.1 hypothetical protein [Aliarcobacter cryaerophilus]
MNRKYLHNETIKIIDIFTKEYTVLGNENVKLNFDKELVEWINISSNKLTINNPFKDNKNKLAISKNELKKRYIFY